MTDDNNTENPNSENVEAGAVETSTTESGLENFDETTTAQNPSGDAVGPSRQDLDMIYDVPVNVMAVLGKATLQVSQLLKLGRGAVVELDRQVGESIDIYVNNKLVARGEVVIVDDRLGITMTDIIKSDRVS